MKEPSILDYLKSKLPWRKTKLDYPLVETDSPAPKASDMAGSVHKARATLMTLENQLGRLEAQLLIPQAVVSPAQKTSPPTDASITSTPSTNTSPWKLPA